MNIKRIALIVVGSIFLGIGAVGAVLPLLPAFPFLLVAAICYGKSSERLTNWFRGTKLYKNNLESFVRGQGMTWRTKIKAMITVTILMAIGMFFLRNNKVGLIILACVWVFHMLLFPFMIKTNKNNGVVISKEEPLEDISIDSEESIAKSAIASSEEAE